MLTLLLACASTTDDVRYAKPSGVDTAGDDSEATDSEATDDSGAVDADGDGFRAREDCDDADAGVNPGAAEVCDGRDQDCDGVADQGIPTDGAGCADPGWPTFPSVVGTVQVVVETASSTNSNSDDPAGFCLGDWCKSLNIVDWDDRELGVFDVHTWEGVSLDRATVDSVRIYTTDGPDRWHPMGISVSFDGEGVYVRSPDDLYIGTEGGAEVSSWEDTLGVYDDTIWPTPITHGPMNGAAFAEGARIWLRTDRTRQVALRVAPTAETLPGTTPVAYRYPGADTDFTTVFEVFGLGSEQAWSYDLTVDGVTYGPWSLVSGPVDGAPGVRRIAFGSCTKDDEQPIFEDIRAEDPDLFLFVGDNHYANSDDLPSLRQFYRWAHERSGRAELLHETSVYATWDDHDYVGNNTDSTASGKDIALRAFEEYWANGSYGLDGVPGVFSEHTYGDIGIWLLDDRYYRGEDDSILGVAQEAWLLASVAASSATFKLIVCGSQWNMDGTDDSWAVFPEAQARVVDALSEIGGVVLLSGDVHYSELVSVAASAYDIPELTSSPLANDARAKVVYIDVDTTVADPTMDVRIVDDDGVVQDTLHVTRSQLE